MHAFNVAQASVLAAAVPGMAQISDNSPVTKGSLSAGRPHLGNSRRVGALSFAVMCAAGLLMAFFLIPADEVLAQLPGATVPGSPALPGSPASPASTTAGKSRHDKAKTASKAASDKVIPQPDISIPTAPLGFAPPAPYYLGSRIAQVSLNFLDEEHLLFTFRVPGLVSREHPASSLAPDEEPTTDQEHNERHIRALVLALPSGKVTAESLWRLHDLAPYLYPLKNQKFLLRDRNTVKIGDAALHLDLFLRFPGSIRLLEMGPDQRFLVANTTEAPTQKAGALATGRPKGNPSSPPVVPDSSPLQLDEDSSEQGSPSPQQLLRILRMDNRTVMLFSRVDGARRIPIDGEGFYEALRGEPLRGNGTSWQISFQDFHGSSTPLQPVDSICSPALDVMASGVVLVSSCPPGGGRELTAITRDKRRLWEQLTPSTKVWAQLARSEQGLRLARATLEVTHPVGVTYPLDESDIRGQSVQVYDLANGKLELTVPASPILDGGGNFALSPSGKRFAVLNAGAIQIYNLPAAPALPAAAGLPAANGTHP